MFMWLYSDGPHTAVADGLTGQHARHFFVLVNKAVL